MKRILLCLLLFVFLLAACSSQPSPSPTSPADVRPAPSETVRQFFAALDAKDYPTAYSLQNQTFQKEIPQEIFRQQLEMGISQAGITKQTSEVTSEKVQGDKATVSYRLLSTMANGSQQEGRGAYTLYWENGAWRMNL
ncbi:MAG: NTF2-like N-terminal transpeptidase domain-containing protein, partial [bacterium]